MRLPKQAKASDEKLAAGRLLITPIVVSQRSEYKKVFKSYRNDFVFLPLANSQPGRRFQDSEAAAFYPANIVIGLNNRQTGRKLERESSS
jgi:hypothetical protein